jgi:hypothetical protein
VEIYLDGSRGERTIYFGNQQRNFEEFRERVYEAVRFAFPVQQFLYPDYKDAIEEDDDEETE